MKVVCLIATWRDGPLLVDAVRSAAPHVDRVIVLDGVYRPLLQPSLASLPWGSDEDELDAAQTAGATIVETSDPWPGEIEKRNVLLALGRAYVEPPLTALVLDADERLVVPHGLDFREHVDEAKPAALFRIEPGGAVWAAPSRLFPLEPDTRYAGRSYWLREGLTRRSLEHVATNLIVENLVTVPHVEHRWHLRDDWRADVQRAWGRQLAELDHDDG